MNVLILGYTGFIGHHLISYLSKKNFFQFHLVSRGREVRNSNNFKYYKCNFENSKKLSKLLKDIKPNICIDMSWEGIPDYSYKNNLKNYNFKKKIYKMLIANNCTKIISLGSCWEYGNTLGKVNEKKSNILNLNNFAKTKIKILKLLQEFSTNYNMKYIWLRIFFVYGPLNKKDSLIPVCYNDLISKKYFKPSNPNGANDFIYVDDVARAIYLCLINNVPKGIYNIGSGKLSSNAHIINLIAKKININFKIKSTKNLKGLYANTSKLSKQTGWKPKVSINNGINKTLKYLSNDNI